MNLIAMIGTVDEIKRNEKTSVLTLKVEKPFFDSTNENDYFDSIDVYVTSALFAQDLNTMNSGSLIGLKGRIKTEENQLKIVAEKIQVF